MLDWLKSTEYQIIEVEKGTKLPQLTSDLKESLKTLSYTPAFQYLMQRMKFQRAALESKLFNDGGLTDSQFRYLQAGIYWLKFLDNEIRQLTTDSPAPNRPTTEDEAEQFQRMLSALEMVGS